MKYGILIICVVTYTKSTMVGQGKKSFFALLSFLYKIYIKIYYLFNI